MLIVDYANKSKRIVEGDVLLTDINCFRQELMCNAEGHQRN